ncbi:uncharacterized protein [Solanum lycopersicum]|uniref:uncharacterized protein n=1 Tax=Solanum lycopersicum TaxID=4081 RepID=UPI003748234A
MYHDLSEHYWWCGIKRDITDFVLRCLTFQQVKCEHQRPGGVSQRMPIPTWKWERITMEFVVGLPTTYIPHESYVLSLDSTELGPDLTFEEEPIAILERFLHLAVNILLPGVNSIPDIFQYNTNDLSIFVSVNATVCHPALFQSKRADSPFCEGVEEVVDFEIEVEGVKPYDFTMASTTKKFRKRGEFSGSYSRGKSSGGYPARPIQSSLQAVAGGPPQTDCNAKTVTLAKPGTVPLVCEGDYTSTPVRIISFLRANIMTFLEKLLAAQSRQKEYADRKVRGLEFIEGEQVLLKVSPMKGVMRFGKRGHVLSDQGEEVDPRNTEAVKNWPKPLTPTDIHNFLGIAGYYCMFVEGFSSIAAPLTALT